MNKHHIYTRTDQIITRVTGITAGIIALALAMWGAITLYDLYNYDETDDAQIESYINPITSRVSGYIKDVRYEENQEVKKGDTLLIIDNREYALQRAEGEAALVNARSQEQVLRNAVETSDKLAAVANAQIDAAKAKLARQQQEYDRFKKLYDAESATKQQLENVETALAVAKSDYQATLNNYQASLSKVNDSRTQLLPLQSEIKRRELMLQRNQLDVSYTIITAPYNGRMGRRAIQPGQQVQVGQTLAFIVDGQAGKWVVANFKETQLKYLKLGKKVEIVADAYPDQKITGEVMSFSPATGSRFSLLPPDNATGNFVKVAQRVPVKIRITDHSAVVNVLSAGMNADVRVKKGDI